VAQAVTDSDTRAALADALHEIDDAFAARIARAQRSGELSADADPVKLAKLASATLYSLTIHAKRAKDDRHSKRLRTRRSMSSAAAEGLAPEDGTLRRGRSNRRPKRPDKLHSHARTLHVAVAGRKRGRAAEYDSCPRRTGVTNSAPEQR